MNTTLQQIEITYCLLQIIVKALLIHTTATDVPYSYSQ